MRARGPLVTEKVDPKKRRELNTARVQERKCTEKARTVCVAGFCVMCMPFRVGGFERVASSARLSPTT